MEVLWDWEVPLKKPDTCRARRAVAFVTGASSGIGKEFARSLARRGCDLVLIARRRERLQELAQELNRSHGVDAEIIAADLARDEDVGRVAEAISAESRTELLVNNAGFGVLGKFHEADPDAQIDMYRVHVLAVARLTRAALQGMIARDRGGIINVSSVAGFTCMPGHASYASTKAWLIDFSECLHLELRSAGSQVQIQALCPGYTYTEFHDVLGLDRSLLMPSRGFWMTAPFVVSESLKAFDRRNWLVIPGWRYRLLVSFLKVVPRAFLHPVVTRMAERRKRAAGINE